MQKEHITLITQDSVLASFNKIFKALTLALAGIAAISLTVAGIGIMNVMLVSVPERTSEIGLMKAVGVTQRQIVLAFLAEGSLLSVAAGSSVSLRHRFSSDSPCSSFRICPHKCRTGP